MFKRLSLQFDRSDHHMKLVRCKYLLASACVFAWLGAVRPASGQDAAQRAIEARTGASVSAADILQRLRSSGVTRAEAKLRLKQAGYDPALVDPYFDQLEAEKKQPGDTTGLDAITRPIPRPSGSLLTALGTIGLLPEARAAAESLLGAEEKATVASRVFGRAMFAGATSQFEPTEAGPVDAEYELGPGDQLMLVITGDVELAYNLDVTRDGYIVIPDVGQIFVSGHTLAEMRDMLYYRLGRVYSGVSRRADATTRFDISLAHVRSLLVYLVGDVVRPGAYQVSAVSKVFNALYRAGGPADQGSFRNVEVRRGGQTVSRIDIYDYLLRGDTRNDIRLAQGDIVFVPPAGPQVDVSGNVRRPGIFEVKSGEGLVDVLSFAGGMAADAFVNRIQIDRILPFAQRQPGRERVLMDVDLEKLLDRHENVAVTDGDQIKVFSVSDERRNRVAVTGDVIRPGDYEYRPGLTVRALIDLASGLLPSAYTPTAHLIREDSITGRKTLIRVTLDSSIGPTSADSIQIVDLDHLVVFGRRTLLNERTVTVSGLVKKPGTYPLADGMSVQDVVLAAGGFLPGAAEYEAEVARMVSSPTRGDTLAVVMRVPLAISADPKQDATGKSSGDYEFQLASGDNVFVRKLAGYTPVETIQIVGEVLYPGAYAVERRTQTISSAVRRAGGLAQEAYVRGFRLIRADKPVAANLQRALEKPGSEYDLLLEPGDRLEIPKYDPTVLVVGAVAFEARVPYRKGLSLGDYLRRAGGTTQDADRGRVSVRYASGEMNTTRRVLLMRRDPSVQPGSTIVVPEASEQKGFDWDNFLSKTLAVLSTFATVAVAASTLK